MIYSYLYLPCCDHEIRDRCPHIYMRYPATNGVMSNKKKAPRNVFQSEGGGAKVFTIR